MVLVISGSEILTSDAGCSLVSSPVANKFMYKMKALENEIANPAPTTPHLNHITMVQLSSTCRSVPAT